VLRGDHPVVHWAEVDWAALRADPQALIVDVREVSEPNSTLLQAAGRLVCCGSVVSQVQGLNQHSRDLGCGSLFS
jgi:hypothetical protein